MQKYYQKALKMYIEYNSVFLLFFIIIYFFKLILLLTQILSKNIKYLMTL